jgi:glycine/D-amino acid oxidase-like deaminating enzyme
LSPADTNKRLNSSNFFGGLLVSTGATVDPVRLVNEIALRSKAVVRDNCLVEAVVQRSDRIEIRTSRHKFVAPVVTVALNAYLPTLFPDLHTMVSPVRAQMLGTSVASGPKINYPVYSHQGYYYLRQTGDGRLLVGGARHLHREEEVGYEDNTTLGLQNDLVRYLDTYFPKYKYQAIDNRWSGTMGFSPDGIPSIGAVPGLDGPQYWAAGFTGHGMSLGFLIGRTLANLAAGHHPHEAAIFNPSRFSASRQTA